MGQSVSPCKAVSLLVLVVAKCKTRTEPVESGCKTRMLAIEPLLSVHVCHNRGCFCKSKIVQIAVWKCGTLVQKNEASGAIIIADCREKWFHKFGNNFTQNFGEKKIA